MSKTKRYWTGLDQLHNTPEFQESAENEFAPDASAEHLLESENLDEGKTKRRDFLKFLGFSVGAATMAACETPVNKAIPYLNKPEEVTPGVPNYYLLHSLMEQITLAFLLKQERVVLLKL
jgi:molybdopterin-containing oxidoreductase family iron-sulfur binding subunit